MAFILEVGFAQQPYKYEPVLTKSFAKHLYFIVTSDEVTTKLETIAPLSKTRIPGVYLRGNAK